MKMKSLEFIYQENEIHFLVNPSDKNVMINATEMAKIFDKRVDVFMRSDHAKSFISILERTPFGGRSEPFPKEEIVKYSGHVGVLFCRPLALKFAAWLDPEFELWVYTKIDDILFGNYQKHWDAHAQQEKAKVMMEAIKSEILLSPTAEKVNDYFHWERVYKDAKNTKTRAIKNQLRLFDENFGLEE